MPTARTLTDRASLLAAAETAGLLAAAQLAKATGAMPPDATTAAAAAQFLVAAGLLTRFQADRLLAGRTDGFVLGHYVVLEQVGRGVSGRVYKARHRTMNRPVAIKVLSAELTRTALARQLFQREVRAAARLNHPNVVTAYDANEVGERFYLVSEFVDGPSVAALVRERGPLPVGEACELVRQAAVGLQHAHEQGMAHRDVKPQNLLVAQASRTHPGCVVKVADFGIARLTPPGPGPRPVRTPDFVAPELAHDPQAADHRADLYSLGCVFYYLLTGQVPFPGGTAEEKVLRHRFEMPFPVERQRADVPPAVLEVVYRLLAKDPNARYQSAAAVAARLDAFAAGAVAVEDDGTLVSFDLPAVAPTPYALGSGYLTGMLPPASDTSPWAQITTEAPAPAAGRSRPIAPVKPQTRARLAPSPAPAPRRARGRVSSLVLLALCAAALVGCAIGVGLLLHLAR